MGWPSNSQIKDLRGGWYDAGDFNKYTSWTARYIIVLLRAYEEHPQAFSDDYGIPESGNGIPDILDEVRWGLDWLRRMQNSDGSLLCVQGLDSASPPSDAKGVSFYGPPTTSATLMAASAFAYASKIFASRPEPDLKRYADGLKEHATLAWTWATANPHVLYYNNDELKQPGSKGLAAGQQEMSETDRLRAQLEAATYLFEMTGAPQFRLFADSPTTKGCCRRGRFRGVCCVGDDLQILVVGFNGLGVLALFFVSFAQKFPRHCQTGLVVGRFHKTVDRRVVGSLI